MTLAGSKKFAVSWRHGCSPAVGDNATVIRQTSVAAFMATFLLAGCGHGSSHAAPPGGTTTPTTGSSAISLGQPGQTIGAGSTPSASSSTVTPVQNLVVTDSLRAQLVAAGAALHQLTAADFTGLQPGLTYYAFDAQTDTFWAGAGLVPSPTSYQAQVSTQDDGSYILFERQAGGSWIGRDVGQAGAVGTPCPVVVPPGVLSVWGWPAGSCRPRP